MDGTNLCRRKAAGDIYLLIRQSGQISYILILTEKLTNTNTVRLTSIPYSLTHIHACVHTHIQTNLYTHTQTNLGIYKYTYRYTDNLIHTYRQAYIHTYV